MYAGTNTNTTQPSWTVKTGLAEFELLGFNPTKQQIEEWQGRELPFEVSYDIREDLSGNPVRPLNVYVKGPDNLIEKFTINIGLHSNVARESGSTQFVNYLGQFRYAKSLHELVEKYPTFGEARPAREGEHELFTFIQRLVRYKASSEDANFIADNEAAGITNEAIYNGDYSGLNKLTEYAQEKRYKVILLLGVKETTGEDGKNKYRQVIVFKPELVFTSYGKGVTKWHKDRLQEEFENKKAAGYNLTNFLFTIDYHAVEPGEFDKSICLNNVPNNPQQGTTNWA